MMPESEGAREYWDQRARQYGIYSPGYSTNLVLDQYEQTLRWKAFLRIYPVTAGIRALDVGCGVGTWCVRLSKLGCKVVGVDTSPAMLRMAPRVGNVEYTIGTAQELSFAAQTFDLALSITVLQHILDEPQFDRAVENFHRILKNGGHAAVLEYSPSSVKTSVMQPSYMRYKSRREWIDAFEKRGFRLVNESGIRFIGQRFYCRVISALQRFAKGENIVDSAGCPVNWLAKSLRQAAWSIDLGLARLPSAWVRSDTNLFLFKKSGAPA